MNAPFHPESGHSERADRTLTMLVVAKLRVRGIEGLCRIRNISPGGLMFETRLPLDCGDRADIDLRQQREVSGRIVWVRGDRAGMAFDLPEAVDELLPSKPGRTSRIRREPQPRGPRLQMDCTVEVRLPDGRAEAQLKDISQGGAKVSLPFHTQVGERLLLLVPGLPLKLGIVRWLQRDDVGIAFAEPLGFDLLADWLVARSGGFQREG